MTIRIALDAMGGDAAPREPVAGALAAVRQYGVEVILVGDESALRAELQAARERRKSRNSSAEDRIRIVHAPEVIGMDEHPTEAVRAKKESSINVAMRLVRDGEAAAFLTAGNTGAAMAAALLQLKRVKGIARPALGIVIPHGKSHGTLLLDIGANAESRPHHLVQWAHIGSRYMHATYGIPRPRVGLMSIGEEQTKGNALVVETHDALAETSLNFVGNVEGRDVVSGAADVVVTDGFTGNIILKTGEGVAELIFSELRSVVESKLWTRLAGLALLPALRQARRRLDFTEHGGAQLLGIDGVVVIGHGRSNARAIASAIRAARDAVDNRVVEHIRDIGAVIPGAPHGDRSGE